MSCKKTARVRLTKMPTTLRQNPLRLFLLRRWARMMRERFGGEVYLFGSMARGSANARDCDIAIVLTDKQFAERYATSRMLATTGYRDIVTQWLAEEGGYVSATGLWSRWIKEARRLQKDAFHKHVGLVVDLHVRPRSDWRGLTNIQFWRLA